ncbi:sugar ABC transporter substrate-binding protein [Caldalkalibacillus mannanilyticus]|uniref:sugar ABC transporter substrate-binding protein n=1 Tax=Caldalkalibacillus mannanilyticus TaxID=1418 RepID=UPI00046899F7|nr:substrate-binding domain-containing protein [Caldalkalibacillus mannanilyticus]
MKGRKKIGVRLIGLFLLILIVAACSQSEVTDPVVEDKLISETDTVFIGFLLDTLQDERWYKDKALFEGAVEKLGGRVKTLAANGLDDVQIKQAELLIEEGVDVLVVVPHDAEVSAAIVELAHEAGIKVISYDRLIRNADVDYYISFDNEKVGELQATEILKSVSSGNIAYIGGSETDNNAILFRQGAMKVLQPFIDKGELNLVHDQYTDGWNPAVAEKNMQTALRENANRIDAVIAANDGTAGGVIRALAAVGLAGSVPVSGQDAELEAVRRVVQGTQTMTVYKSINLLAEQAASMAVKVAQGQEIATDKTIQNGKTEVPSIFLEPITVTKENVRETVVKDGYLKEEEIY